MVSSFFLKSKLQLPLNSGHFPVAVSSKLFKTIAKFSFHKISLLTLDFYDLDINVKLSYLL